MLVNNNEDILSELHRCKTEILAEIHVKEKICERIQFLEQIIRNYQEKMKDTQANMSALENHPSISLTAEQNKNQNGSHTTLVTQPII